MKLNRSPGLAKFRLARAYDILTWLLIPAEAVVICVTNVGSRYPIKQSAQLRICVVISTHLRFVGLETVVAAPAHQR